MLSDIKITFSWSRAMIKNKKTALFGATNTKESLEPNPPTTGDMALCYYTTCRLFYQQKKKGGIFMPKTSIISPKLSYLKNISYLLRRK